jgi:hypothetical protein
MDPLIEPLAEDAWTHLPPAAAALFIVLILVLVGGIWLATTYMRTYGLRRSGSESEETEQPPTKTGPGPNTLLGLTRAEVDKARARSNRTQDERLARLENQLDTERTRLDKLFEIEGRHRSELLFEIRKLDERIDKMWDLK